MAKGKYQHKTNQGFQKGHKGYVSSETYKSESRRKKLKEHHNPKSDLNLTYRIPKGNNPWNKGSGINPIYQNVRSCLKYRQWKSDIYTRDGFVCQKCGSKNKIHAHHIEPWNDIFKKNNIKTHQEAEACEELWNLNNGQTLCEHCHHIIHIKK